MKQNMDDGGEVESYLDDLLKNNRTCTHTHTCNGPPEAAVHSHTCYHTHTQLIPTQDTNHQSLIKQHSRPKPRRSSGNREAVRKYREKKKAQTAFLEEEVKKLRALNQQLVRKLQGQASLEAEVFRLRSLLVDVKGKIDSELGVFPVNKVCSVSAGSTIGFKCRNDVMCFGEPAGVSVVDGQVNVNEMLSGEGQTLESIEGLVSSVSQAE